jgi:hypothetical protein
MPPLARPVEKSLTPCSVPRLSVDWLSCSLDYGPGRTDSLHGSIRELPRVAKGITPCCKDHSPTIAIFEKLSPGQHGSLHMIRNPYIEMAVLIPHGSPSGPHGFRPVGFYFWGTI